MTCQRSFGPTADYSQTDAHDSFEAHSLAPYCDRAIVPAMTIAVMAKNPKKTYP